MEIKFTALLAFLKSSNYIYCLILRKPASAAIYKTCNQFPKRLNTATASHRKNVGFYFQCHVTPASGLKKPKKQIIVFLINACPSCEMPRFDARHQTCAILFYC